MEILSACNVSFHQKLEPIQHNVTSALTEAIRGTFREKLYHKLGFESLESRSWYRKLCCFYKVFKAQSPKYLFDLTPITKRAHITRNDDTLPFFQAEHNYFKYSCFPSTVNEWNKNLVILILPKFSFMEETS